MSALLKVLNRVTKETNKMLGLHQLLMFVRVAEAGELGQGELPALLGVGQSAVARNMDLLGAGNPYKGSIGYRLLEAFQDPRDRKAKRIILTERGKALWREIQGILQEGK